MSDGGDHHHDHDDHDDQDEAGAFCCNPRLTLLRNGSVPSPPGVVSCPQQSVPSRRHLTGKHNSTGARPGGPGGKREREKNRACLRVSGSVRMVSECVRQMSGVGRCHMQCQKHNSTGARPGG